MVKDVKSKTVFKIKQMEDRSYVPQYESTEKVFFF